jgi:hypothetical protein
MTPKYGARVYFPDTQTVLVKQTVMKGGRYVVDIDEGGHREQHITMKGPWQDRLAKVIEYAKDGRLPSKGEI